MSAESAEDESLENCLAAKHRREKKELLAEIQKLKHGVPKGDKKKKKEIADRVELLESELEQRHKAEIAQSKETPVKDSRLSTNELCDKVESIDVKDQNGFTSQPADSLPEFKFNESEKKSNKNKRRKEKKEQKNQQKENMIKEQELENVTGRRHVEAEKIKQLLRARNLIVHEIPSDGNCLYSAIENQLRRRDILEHNVTSLRRQTAEYMRCHPDEFLPFLAKEGSDDLYTHNEFDEYCRRIETTSEWGGHTEIRALSDVLEAPIEIVQAEGPSVIIGEQFEHLPLILSYHRHAYGLGEHYNSVVPVPSSRNSSTDLKSTS